MSADIIILDPLFDDGNAANMVALCERFGRYRMYAEHEQRDDPITEGLAQRHDALTNFLRTGGLARASEPMDALAVRTSYFREEYAYGRDERIDGIAPFLYHPAFVDAAQRIHGRRVIEPAIAYANLMVPGQELAVHTDVPEFRGANRKLLPQWLLVVMHHSGLFDEYRMPIATTIAWLGPRRDHGGALAYWPDGIDGEMRLRPARYNTAMVLDTDSVFHGVARVAEVGIDELPPIRYGTTLDHVDGPTWALHNVDGEEIASYDWEQIRFSVSWKAYCFRDEHERDAWRTHSDDLTLDMILDRLVDDVVARGVVDSDVERDGALGQLLIDEHIKFPSAKS